MPRAARRGRVQQRVRWRARMKITPGPVAATMLKVAYGAGGRTVASAFPDMV
jgi:hypothetical protein